MAVDDIISRLKRFGADSIKREDGVSGIDVEDDARALVNDLERYPHAFVLACIVDRQTKSDIAWSLPHAIREAASGFEFDKLLGLQTRVWVSVLRPSGHRLAAEMERLLPAAIRHIGDRYGGDASRIWATGSSGAAVARRFLAFDGVGPKISNMAVNILIRDFGIHLTRPMPDIAVDTHVLRVFERLGLLGRLDHSQLRSTQGKQQLRLQLRARELNPEWPGELDWPAWLVGKTWCHAGRAPECHECHMRSLCPREGVSSIQRQAQKTPAGE
ncbi:iron-sulfur cluster loop [Candidatus Palauibacter sp.]|uniref:iron-sulfur cluster loop n=1 Tax=Candidatus Palauibacter sp. TaxID=3101350 RepID=UPI003C6EF43A